MKKMIIGGLAAGAVALALFAVPVGVGTANAAPQCPYNYEYHPSDGLCYAKPISRQTGATPASMPP
jgi:hypothetical protein